MMKFKKLFLAIKSFTLGNYHYSQCSNLSVAAGNNTNLVTETLYEETFSGQINKGAYGSTIDVSECNWTIDVSSATLSNNSDWFKVNSNERMEGQDTDGECKWYSPTINIANYHNISLSLFAFKQGFVQTNSTNYYVKTEYSLDGGIWNQFSGNGLLNFNYANNTNVFQNGLEGNYLQIRVTVKTTSSNRKMRFDDVKVTGQTYKTNLCYGSSLNLGGSTTANWTGSGTPVISYTWTPSTSLDDPTIANPVANLQVM